MLKQLIRHIHETHGTVPLGEAIPSALFDGFQQSPDARFRVLRAHEGELGEDAVTGTHVLVSPIDVDSVAPRLQQSFGMEVIYHHRYVRIVVALPPQVKAVVGATIG